MPTVRCKDSPHSLMTSVLGWEYDCMSKNRFAMHTQSNSKWINIKLSALQYWTRANHERKRKWIYCCSGGLHQPIRNEIGYSFRIVAAFSLSTLFSTIYIILSKRIRSRRGNCNRWNAPSNASRCDSKPSRRPYWLKLAHSLMRANKYFAFCARRKSAFVMDAKTFPILFSPKCICKYDREQHPGNNNNQRKKR